MADENGPADAEPKTTADEEAVPLMQRFLDNPFLLLMLGIAIPTTFYILWGIMEIIQIPIAE